MHEMWNIESFDNSFDNIAGKIDKVFEINMKIQSISQGEDELKQLNISKDVILLH